MSLRVVGVHGRPGKLGGVKSPRWFRMGSATTARKGLQRFLEPGKLLFDLGWEEGGGGRGVRWG